MVDSSDKEKVATAVGRVTSPSWRHHMYGLRRISVLMESKTRV